eukprot:TRINITY_DN4911_c4_g1_i1.p2 TRINITY_DN4911_c4_g1~~TRINITY_DN4911_c4_g1_i1.p2  ORF type:complete len:282 (+),score=99.64 TRINITY_DN4911_c4_g1_i1:81-848(+)
MAHSGNATAADDDSPSMQVGWALVLSMSVCAGLSGLTTGVCAFGTALTFLLLLTLVRTVGGTATGVGVDMRELVAAAPVIAIPGQFITVWWLRALVRQRLPLVAAMLPVGTAGLAAGTAILHSMPLPAARPVIGCLFLFISLHQLTADLRRWVAGRQQQAGPAPAPAERAAERRPTCVRSARERLVAAVPEHGMRSDGMFLGSLLVAGCGSGTLFGLIAAPGPPMAAFFAHAGVTVNEARVLTSPLAFAARSRCT